ncbi:ScyD/ScyE family protein [Ornithinimicrobium faecis]|uniref:ScyD/ScyE family protein n=1 Tax=Ornithinimicrobium faecis TaxID=2934158 RepID=UPI0021185E91|nr:ScyD/ScyE family protein [Ornithinimicrobium sp. HY1745]
MPSVTMRVLGGVAAACLATTAFTSTAAADNYQPDRHRPIEGTVVATGLNSPRHLTAAPNGDLYVAEAGTGGDDCLVMGEEGPVLDEGVPIPCGSWDPEEHPDWGEIRLGDTGSITKITRKGHQSRVVTGLPAVDLGGGEATGPSDVAVRGNKLMVTVGLGADPAVRDLAADLFDEELYEDLATVQQVKLSGKKTSARTVADLGQFEADNNPHPAMVDTNPNAIVSDGSGWIITDAGGNSVLRMDHKGRLSTLAVPPGGEAEAPPFLELPPGTMIPFEPVPTAAERGRDGSVYISVLTGFPFPVGGSTIWKVSPSGKVTSWATGLTNVTDLTFGPDGSLYAVQLANNGLLSEDLTGSLLKIRKGKSTHQVIADGLFAPYGVTVHKSNAYVTTGTVVPGGGEVVRFDLRRCR